MKATFILALMVASAMWSTSGRSSTFISVSSISSKTVPADQEPDECVTLPAAAEVIVHSEYNLPNTSVTISAEALCDQIQNLDSHIDFLSSVSLALNSFINDTTDIESPLSIATDLAFNELGIAHIIPVPDRVKAKAREILLTHLNKPSAKLELLPRSETPEGGESVDENWILHLKIADLSDHSYWAVVHRSGRVRTYNYGFN